MKLDFPSTRISRGGKPIELQFKAPEFVYKCPVADPLPKYRRSGHGNYEIKPPAFYAAAPKARIVQFEGLSVSSLAMADVKQESNLMREAYVQVADILDNEWINEEARLRALLTRQFITVVGRSNEVINAMVNKELSINKPLGRDQRTVEIKTSDIANQPGLTLTNKLLEILNEIKAGRVENLDERKAMTGQLIKIFNKPNAIKELTELKTQDLINLGTSIRDLGLPTDNKNAGIPDVVDNDYFKKNRGIITLYLMGVGASGINGLSPDDPVRSSDGNKTSLFTMVNSLSNKNKQVLLYVGGQRLLRIEDQAIEVLSKIVATNDGSYNVDFRNVYNTKSLRKLLRSGGINPDVNIFDSRNQPVNIVVP